MTIPRGDNGAAIALTLAFAVAASCVLPDCDAPARGRHHIKEIVE